MTPAQLAAIAAALGLSGRAMARALDVDEKTYRRWLKGNVPISRVVVLACEGLLARKAAGQPLTPPPA